MAHAPTPLPDQFAATRWTMVLAAGDLRAGSRARHALEELARIYWFPLYAYLRRQGKPATEAEDLTQSFFTQLIEKNSLGGADRSKGKFRAFLLTSLKHFIINEWDKSRAQKRGGGCTILSLDSAAAETRYATEPADDRTPERVYERRWALAMLDQVLNTLRDIYTARGQADLFAALEPALVGGDHLNYASLAAKLGMTESALKVACHRLRRRYRDVLRQEIAQTVADPALIDDELRELLNCL